MSRIIYNNQMDIRTGVDFSQADLYYTDESLLNAITDINDEGSGLLIINCKNTAVLDIFRQTLIDTYKNMCVLETHGNTIWVMVDESDFDSMEEEDVCSDEEEDVCSDEEEDVCSDEEEDVCSDEEEDVCSDEEEDVCSDECKCINCAAEQTELNETICDDGCKCINCSSERS
jgi:hypothetical protein